MSSYRTGLLIIRAWAETGSDEPLRAHIRVTDDVSTGRARTLTLVQSDSVGELVDAWLEDILDADDDGPAAPTDR
jgi:hypothetical protein